MSEHSLFLDNVCVSYSGKTAIRDISLQVNVGEVFGLIGLNGAGKTTMIKSILGLRDQDSGDILVNGLPKASPEGKKKLAYLPEKFEPPWFLSGMEFLKFSLDLYKQPFDGARMEAAARDLALQDGVLKQRVNTYSKGMRQKLGLMGTMLTGCSLFILDEPMSGLDPLARSRVKDLIMRTKREDRTIFLSSHILADMDEICDRVAVLHEGIIRFVGAPDVLKKQSKSSNLEQAFLEFIEQNKIA